MDALDKVIGLGPASGPADGGARFIPSKTFAGPRDGYVFRTSDLGTGYHRDAPAADSSGGGVGGRNAPVPTAAEGTAARKTPAPRGQEAVHPLRRGQRPDHPRPSPEADRRRAPGRRRGGRGAGGRRRTADRPDRPGGPFGVRRAGEGPPQEPAPPCRARRQPRE
ncbi:hypothetical protein THAOC_17976, partial [Thalassiosira oceanica]